MGGGSGLERRGGRGWGGGRSDCDERGVGGGGGEMIIRMSGWDMYIGRSLNDYEIASCLIPAPLTILICRANQS